MQHTLLPTFCLQQVLTSQERRYRENHGSTEKTAVHFMEKPISSFLSPHFHRPVQPAVGFCMALELRMAFRFFKWVKKSKQE